MIHWNYVYLLRSAVVDIELNKVVLLNVWLSYPVQAEQFEDSVSICYSLSKMDELRLIH